MNDCAFRDRLLEADPGELRADGPSALAEHLRSCASCADDAGRILEARRLLAEALDEAPAIDAAALVARARSEAGGAEAHTRRVGARRARWRDARVWAPLLAAAALAGLLLLPDRGPDFGPVAMPAALAPPDVSAPEGTNFAVLPTDDPDITVVWIFKGE